MCSTKTVRNKVALSMACSGVGGTE